MSTASVLLPRGKKAANSYRRDGADPQRRKRAVNSWIAACAAELHKCAAAAAAATAADASSSPPQQQQPAWALVLESSHMLTLGALHRAGCGVVPSSTVVPNPDAEELRRISQAVPEVLALPLSSHALLAALTTPDLEVAEPSEVTVRSTLEARGWGGGFSVVWLDFCGTFGTGAAAARQRAQDIELLFEHHLLAFAGSSTSAGATDSQDERVHGGGSGVAGWPAALLGVTFTGRGASELYHGEQLDSLLLLVSGCAAQHSQHAAPVGAVSYRPAPRKGSKELVTVLFTVRAGTSPAARLPAMPTMEEPPPAAAGGEGSGSGSGSVGRGAAKVVEGWRYRDGRELCAALDRQPGVRLGHRESNHSTEYTYPLRWTQIGLGGEAVFSCSVGFLG